jgi:hypothetical protein
MQRHLLNSGRSPAILVGVTASITVGMAAGCMAREVAEQLPVASKVQFVDVPVRISRNLDILFVIDNSGSMGEEQTALKDNVVSFIDVLRYLEGGLPNLHIGVVSTDVGAGPFAVQRCDEPGDDGYLQSLARDVDCSPPGPENYLVDVADDIGTGRITNYTGALEDAFRCMAGLGTEGCGFEQPLEAMRRALDGRNPGFLRDDAFLLVVFITDEDDCSARNSGLFDPAQSAVDGPLGALDSFRCFEFGVQCSPDEPREPGSKLGCASREDSPYLTPVQDYIDFLKALKPDPSQVMVAGIIGDTDAVSVAAVPNSDGVVQPALQPSCSSPFGQAHPGIRLAQVLAAFPHRNTVHTICPEDGDLSGALALLAEPIDRWFGQPCLPGRIALPPQCEVFEVRFAGTESQEEIPIAPCPDAASGGEKVCWVVEADPLMCPDEQQLALRIRPEGRTRPAGTQVHAYCLGQ